MKYIVVAIRNLCLSIDQLMITLNGYLFQIFLGLTQLKFKNSYLFDRLATRLYVLIGIFMVFRITFSLIQMLANPDLMADKEKGMGKLASRIVISLALLVLTPFIFEKALELQNVVLEENIVGQVILGINTNNNSTTVKSQGENLAFQVFKGFVSPNEEADQNDNNYKVCDARYADSSLTTINELIYPYYPNINKLNCLTETTSNGEFIYSYLFIVSTIASLILAWMIVGFCISVATRLIKLGFYQIIAPIPIISYINGDKNGPFNSWVKRCISTYVSVFIKLVVIYFIIYMCNIITRSGLDMTPFENTSPGVKQLAMVAVLLGLITFAQTAPKLIKDMFGIKGDDDEGGFGKKLAQAALLGGAGMIVGGVNRAGANARNLGNVLRDKNASAFDKLRAGAGILTGAAGGAISGAARNGIGGYRNGLGAFRDIGKNNQRMNELANRRFARQAAFRADNPASSGFANRMAARVAGVGTRAGDMGSTFFGGGTRAERQDRVLQNLKNISDLRNQMKSQADYYTGDRGGRNVKALKQHYEDLMHSGTASQTDITNARNAYESAQEEAITILASDENTAIGSLAREMQRNAIEGQNSSYHEYFDGMDDLINGVYNNDSTKSAFIAASNNQIRFQNSSDYVQAHSQSNNNNNR